MTVEASIDSPKPDHNIQELDKKWQPKHRANHRDRVGQAHWARGGMADCGVLMQKQNKLVCVSYTTCVYISGAYKFT